MLRQLICFAGVGAAATLVQFAILLALVELLATPPVSASAAGFAISSIFNYLANYHFTFGSSKPHALAAARFGVVASVGLLLNVVGMYLLQETLAVQYVLAQVVSTGVVLVWSFLANRHWTYGAAHS